MDITELSFILSSSKYPFGGLIIILPIIIGQFRIKLHRRININAYCSSIWKFSITAVKKIYLKEFVIDKIKMDFIINSINCPKNWISTIGMVKDETNSPRAANK